MSTTCPGLRDAFISKYDASGTLEWIRQLGTSSHDSGAVSADGLGSVYISGFTAGSLGGNTAGNADAFVAKYRTDVPEPGDVNGDGVADQQDFEIILRNFMESTTARRGGDLNVDGIVDFADFRLWKNAAAGVATTASSAAVPEPGSSILISVALVCCACRSRRDRLSHCVV